MNAVLLPVKEFSRSKQRLVEVLSREERELLARTMFEDVWKTLLETLKIDRGFDRLLVTTSEPHVMECCKKEGVACLEETEQLSHSESVIRATRWAMALGVRTLLSVPIDTPALSPQDIVTLFEYGARTAVVIVPSGDGTGTNALLRTPPDAIDPHFGPGSCRLHSDEAEARGASHVVARIPGIMADIDTAADLEEFLKYGSHTASARLIRQFLASRRGVPACP